MDDIHRWTQKQENPKECDMNRDPRDQIKKVIIRHFQALASGRTT